MANTTLASLNSLLSSLLIPVTLSNPSSITPQLLLLTLESLLETRLVLNGPTFRFGNDQQEEQEEKRIRSGKTTDDKKRILEVVEATCRDVLSEPDDDNTYSCYDPTSLSLLNSAAQIRPIDLNLAVSSSPYPGPSSSSRQEIEVDKLTRLVLSVGTKIKVLNREGKVRDSFLKGESTATGTETEGGATSGGWSFRSQRGPRNGKGKERARDSARGIGRERRMLPHLTEEDENEEEMDEDEGTETPTPYQSYNKSPASLSLVRKPSGSHLREWSGAGSSRPPSRPNSRTRSGTEDVLPSLHTQYEGGWDGETRENKERGIGTPSPVLTTMTTSWSGESASGGTGGRNPETGGKGKGREVAGHHYEDVYTNEVDHRQPPTPSRRNSRLNLSSRPTSVHARPTFAADLQPLPHIRAHSNPNPDSFPSIRTSASNSNLVSSIAAPISPNPFTSNASSLPISMPAIDPGNTYYPPTGSSLSGPPPVVSSSLFTASTSSFPSRPPPTRPKSSITTPATNDDALGERKSSALSANGTGDGPAPALSLKHFLPPELLQIHKTNRRVNNVGTSSARSLSPYLNSAPSLDGRSPSTLNKYGVSAGLGGSVPTSPRKKTTLERMWLKHLEEKEVKERIEREEDEREERMKKLRKREKERQNEKEVARGGGNHNVDRGGFPDYHLPVQQQSSQPSSGGRRRRSVGEAVRREAFEEQKEEERRKRKMQARRDEEKGEVGHKTSCPCYTEGSSQQSPPRTRTRTKEEAGIGHREEPRPRAIGHRLEDHWDYGAKERQANGIHHHENHHDNTSNYQRENSNRHEYNGGPTEEDGHQHDIPRHYNNIRSGDNDHAAMDVEAELAGWQSHCECDHHHYHPVSSNTNDPHQDFLPESRVHRSYAPPRSNGPTTPNGSHHLSRAKNGLGIVMEVVEPTPPQRGQVVEGIFEHDGWEEHEDSWRKMKKRKRWERDSGLELGPWGVSDPRKGKGKGKEVTKELDYPFDGVHDEGNHDSDVEADGLCHCHHDHSHSFDNELDDDGDIDMEPEDLEQPGALKRREEFDKGHRRRHHQHGDEVGNHHRHRHHHHRNQDSSHKHRLHSGPRDSIFPTGGSSKSRPPPSNSSAKKSSHAPFSPQHSQPAVNTAPSLTTHSPLLTVSQLTTHSPILRNHKHFLTPSSLPLPPSPNPEASAIPLPSLSEATFTAHPHQLQFESDSQPPLVNVSNIHKGNNPDGGKAGNGTTTAGEETEVEVRYDGYLTVVGESEVERWEEEAKKKQSNLEQGRQRFASNQAGFTGEGQDIPNRRFPIPSSPQPTHFPASSSRGLDSASLVSCARSKEEGDYVKELLKRKEELVERLKELNIDQRQEQEPEARTHRPGHRPGNSRDPGNGLVGKSQGSAQRAFEEAEAERKKNSGGSMLDWVQEQRHLSQQRILLPQEELSSQSDQRTYFGTYEDGDGDGKTETRTTIIRPAVSKRGPGLDPEERIDETAGATMGSIGAREFTRTGTTTAVGTAAQNSKFSSVRTQIKGQDSAQGEIDETLSKPRRKEKVRVAVRRLPG